MKNIPENLLENIALHKLTTFRVGGKARYFAEVSNEENLRTLLLWAHKKDCPVFCLGRGSNLVISDEGLEGLVIHFGKKMGRIEVKKNRIVAQCGALLHNAVLCSIREGLAGLQHLAGIPGSLGGGANINAGAFGQELAQSITRVRSMDPRGKTHERNNEECRFGYRRSIFGKLNEIITEIELELTPADPKALRLDLDETLRKRKSKQPLELPNAGSLFKRPPGTYAGKLIEEAGLKGFRRGNAAISDKHANFAVNLGGASAQEINDLSREVIARVKKQFGISLEREVVFFGDFLPWPR